MSVQLDSPRNSNLSTDNRSNVPLLSAYDALTKLAYIGIHYPSESLEAGPKFSFSQHSITIDKPGIAQGAVRAASGSNGHDLVGVVNAIYIATLLLPKASELEREEKENFLKLARQGLVCLVKRSYRHDRLVQSYLSTVALPIIDKALKDEEIDPKRYFLGEPSESMINKVRQVWHENEQSLKAIDSAKKGPVLKRLVRNLVEAYEDKLAGRKGYKATLNKALEDHDEIHKQIASDFESRSASQSSLVSYVAAGFNMAYQAVSSGLNCVSGKEDGGTIEWVDPGAVLTGFSMMPLLSAGSKLGIEGEKMVVDQGLFAPVFRMLGGRSSADFFNLITSIKYAIDWFRPDLEEIKNAKGDREPNPGRALFLRAHDGLEFLIQETYKNDPLIQHFLSAVHLQMIRDGLEGKSINHDEFLISNQWDRYQKKIRSQEVWADKQETLKTILGLYEQADKSKNNYEKLNTWIKSIFQMTEEVLEETKQGFVKPDFVEMIQNLPIITEAVAKTSTLGGTTRLRALSQESQPSPVKPAWEREGALIPTRAEEVQEIGSSDEEEEKLVGSPHKPEIVEQKTEESKPEGSKQVKQKPEESKPVEPSKEERKESASSSQAAKDEMVLAPPAFSGKKKKGKK